MSKRLDYKDSISVFEKSNPHCFPNPLNCDDRCSIDSLRILLRFWTPMTWSPQPAFSPGILDSQVPPHSATFPITPLSPHTGRTRTSGTEQLRPSPTARQASCSSLGASARLATSGCRDSTRAHGQASARTAGRCQPCAPSSWARAAPQPGSEALQDL